MRLPILLSASLLLLLTGCASGPKLPFMRTAKKTVGMDRVFQKDQEELASAHGKRSIVSHLTPEKKPIWSRLWSKPQPRVVKANDPVTLATKGTATADVHIQAARLHEQRGDMPAAASAYARALAIEADNEVALLSFARLYDRNDRFDEAAKLYQRAAEAHPESSRSHNDYGLCLVRQGNTPEGLKELTRAVELSPQDARYRNNIGQVLVGAGRIEDGLEHLRVVHSEAAAHYNVGYWLQTNGNMDAALSHFVRAAELDPSMGAAQTMVAQLRPQVVR